MKAEKKDVVLIIDDDNRNTFALQLTLKVKGFKSVSSTSAAEGLHILASNKQIGLVLMDMMMPEMDGYEALERIHSSDQYPDVPIIAVTAQAMSGDREKCIAAGATDYIAKPIDVDILMQVVNKWM